MCGDTEDPRSPLRARLRGVWGASGCGARSGAGARRPALSPRCPSPVPPVSLPSLRRCVSSAACGDNHISTAAAWPGFKSPERQRGRTIASLPTVSAPGGAPGHPLPTSLISLPPFFPPSPAPSPYLRCSSGALAAGCVRPPRSHPSPPGGLGASLGAAGGGCGSVPKPPRPPAPKGTPVLPAAHCGEGMGIDLGLGWGFRVGVGVWDGDLGWGSGPGWGLGSG